MESCSQPAVSVMIFTLNEEIHLAQCLECLHWCDDVIVVDSFSTDRTKEICEVAEVRFFQHRFERMDKQRNWALEETEPRHEWILILDADERVTPELREELSRVSETADTGVAAYRVKRRFHMWGRWLPRSSLYPTWIVRLLRRGRVHYENVGHGEVHVADGDVLELENDLIDENLKGLEAWLNRQARYALQEARHELRNEKRPIRLEELLTRDPLARRAVAKRLFSKVPGRAAAYFFYTYLVRGGVLEGRDGLMLCLLKSMYQQMIVAMKHELAREQVTSAARPVE